MGIASRATRDADRPAPDGQGSAWAGRCRGRSGNPVSLAQAKIETAALLLPRQSNQGVGWFRRTPAGYNGDTLNRPADEVPSAGSPRALTGRTAIFLEIWSRCT